MINRRFALGVVFFTALMDSIGFGIILPVTPTLLMEVSDQGLSSSAVYGGWLMFSFAIMQFVSMPVLGNLSDAYGRKPVLLGSLLVLSINYLIMGLAQSLVLLFIGRLISGIGSATFSTCFWPGIRYRACLGRLSWGIWKPGAILCHRWADFL
jgi:DHA1 family tetracycline resistance protein-like MFS transporter